MPGLTEKVTAIALSPDGRFAAGGEFAGVGLLGDVGTAKELARTPDDDKATKVRAVFTVRSWPGPARAVTCCCSPCPTSGGVGSSRTGAP